jgi:hypothetical protein
MPSWYSGHVTYYILCNGSNGACAGYGYPCSDSQWHCAWPNLSTTGCYFNCGSPVKQCGDTVYMMGSCEGFGAYVQIRDCCPCSAQEPCSTQPRCAEGWWTNHLTPLADVTSATFIGLGGDLAWGRLPIELYA